jgi:hypothetical protein
VPWVPGLPRGRGGRGPAWGLLSQPYVTTFVLHSRLPASARPPHLCRWSVRGARALGSWVPGGGDAGGGHSSVDLTTYRLRLGSVSSAATRKSGGASRPPPSCWKPAPATESSQPPAGAPPTSCACGDSELGGTAALPQFAFGCFLVLGDAGGATPHKTQPGARSMTRPPVGVLLWSGDAAPRSHPIRNHFVIHLWACAACTSSFGTVHWSLGNAP